MEAKEAYNADCCRFPLQRTKLMVHVALQFVTRKTANGEWEFRMVGGDYDALVDMLHTALAHLQEADADTPAIWNRVN